MVIGGIFVVSILLGTSSVNGINYYGVSLGQFKNVDGDVLADVWLANSTFVQLSNANIPKNEDLKFVFGNNEETALVDEVFIVNGNGKRAYSSKISQNSDIPNYGRLFFKIPDNLSAWNKLALYNEKTRETVASIKIDKKAPEPFCCLQNSPDKGIIGTEYNVSTGPITILDSRTFAIPALAFEGNRAPDGWVFAGNGEVNQASGHKLQVLGRDEETHYALHEHYDGTTGIVARLPAQLTIYDIDYLAMFCYRYDVDFGHINFNFKPEETPVPAYIPPISIGPLSLPKKCD